MSLNGEEIEKGTRHLRRADPVMRTLMQKAGPYTLKLRRNRFHALVSSIISQQISGGAARSIRQRLHDHFAPETLSPQNLAALSPEILRTLGLSPQKASYLMDLSTRVSSGELR